VNAIQCMLCPNGTISKIGSTDCAACPAGTISAKNGTECKDPNAVHEDQNQGEETPKKSNNTIYYVLGGVAIIAILLIVVISQNMKKPADEVESEKEIKISLVPQNTERYNDVNA